MADARRPQKKTGFGESEAFVLQIDPPPEAEERAIRGRIEHLASGAEIHFGSVDDLLAFVRGCSPKPGER